MAMHSAVKGKLLAVIGDEVSTMSLLSSIFLSVHYYYTSKNKVETRPFLVHILYF